MLESAGRAAEALLAAGGVTVTWNFRDCVVGTG